MEMEEEQEQKCQHHWIISEDGRSGMCRKCGATREFPPNPFEEIDTRELKMAARLARRIRRITDAQLLGDTVSWEELQRLEYRKYEEEEREIND